MCISRATRWTIFPAKRADGCRTELRRLYDRRIREEARRDLAAWPAKWQGKHPNLCDWVEANIEKAWSFCLLSFRRHKRMNSTNMLERLNEEIKRRTHVARIFSNTDRCLRLVCAPAAAVAASKKLFERFLLRIGSLRCCGA